MEFYSIKESIFMNIVETLQETDYYDSELRPTLDRYTGPEQFKTLEETDYPFILIEMGDAQRAPASVGNMGVMLDVNVLIVLNTIENFHETVDYLIDATDKALAVDRTRGGLALYSNLAEDAPSQTIKKEGLTITMVKFLINYEQET